jgi:hypothetical protein
MAKITGVTIDFTCGTTRREDGIFSVHQLKYFFLDQGIFTLVKER